MRILTFGWDFPPQTSGGLGVACYGLTKELTREGIEVVFVLPRSQKVHASFRFIFADIERFAKFRAVPSELVPYRGSESRIDVYDETGRKVIYSSSILEEVHRYAHEAAKIAREEQFDIIHAHDWTSYLAGIAAKIASGKPLILHVHATSFDQAGGDNVDPEIFKIEKESFAQADSIIAISEYVKKMIITKHGAPAEKIAIIHNGCQAEEPERYAPVLEELKKQGKKVVLYHGRITIQKGIDHFVNAARRVLDVRNNVVFVISGSGDMKRQIMHQVASLGMSTHFIFAGALWDEDRDRMYQSADLLVMPSVSEPFGLVPLEAIRHGTPALISKQSGVAEVLTHALKVDFWDVEEMANKIIAALDYGVLNQQLVTEGKKELWKITWAKAAEKVVTLYRKMLGWFHT